MQILTPGKARPSRYAAHMSIRDPHVIGQKLRARRLELGLTQAQAAERCHVSAASIAHLELGSREPSLRMLRALEAGLEMDFAVAPLHTRSHQALIDRLAAVLPTVPEEDLSPFLAQLALWEKKYGPGEAGS